MENLTQYGRRVAELEAQGMTRSDAQGVADTEGLCDVAIDATYSPEDNKLRLYPAMRLDAATYARVKAAGFKWAPKQELFVAPMWTPARADLCEALAGEIGDEDKSLVERQEERAGRFDEYSDKRRADSASATAAVKRIADGIPLGQPILVGHHSEAHARREAKRIENGMRKAVKMWETAQYWQDRAAGALAHASYKERPDVRARRIKGLEADERKQLKNVAAAEQNIRLWSDPLGRLRIGGKPFETLRAAVVALANYGGGHYATEYARPSGYVGPISLWEAAGGNIDGEDPEARAIATCAEIQAKAIENQRARLAYSQRWLQHYQNRLAYERAMLGQVGGTAADKAGPQKGGAVKCWVLRDGWSYIQKVNKVSVTVLDNWGNGGRNFTRTIPFDKLQGVMTPAEVQAARDAGRLVEIEGRGFRLLDEPPPTPRSVEPETTPAEIDAMRASVKAGVTVQAVNQLFPTPRDLAERVAELADVREGCEVLEPSAGLGALIGAVGCRWCETGGRMVAVEINAGLCDRLRTEFPITDVRCADFLQCNGDLGKFDRIIMNPPFENGADIKHIQHAAKFLKPGGRLVAICANGPRQQRELAAMAEQSGGTYEPLPAGSFSAQGTNVNTALLVIEA